MGETNKQDLFGPVAVAILMLLTAWGNAIAMFSVSLAVLFISLIVFRGRLRSGGALAALAGAVVALAVAALIALLR